METKMIIGIVIAAIVVLALAGFIIFGGGATVFTSIGAKPGVGQIAGDWIKAKNGNTSVQSSSPLSFTAGLNITKKEIATAAGKTEFLSWGSCKAIPEINCFPSGLIVKSDVKLSYTIDCSSGTITCVIDFKKVA